ncbi:MAG TPA: hypothetical protein VGA89_03450 [Patescibacteria group bacterium]|jgi:hypothetical protein
MKKTEHGYRYEARVLDQADSDLIIAYDSEKLIAELMDYCQLLMIFDPIEAVNRVVFVVERIAEDGVETVLEMFTLEAQADRVHRGWDDPSRYDEVVQ